MAERARNRPDYLHMQQNALRDLSERLRP